MYQYANDTLEEPKFLAIELFWLKFEGF
jgi:hypothetical protein